MIADLGFVRPFDHREIGNLVDVTDFLDPNLSQVPAWIEMMLFDCSLGALNGRIDHVSNFYWTVECPSTEHYQRG